MFVSSSPPISPSPCDWFLVPARRGHGFRQSIQEERRIAGLIVVLPLLVSGLTLVWVARLIEGTMSPLLDWLLGRSIPGPRVRLGAGPGDHRGARRHHRGRLPASSVRASSIMARIPLFKDIYVPVKQLVTAFSPENESRVQARGAGALRRSRRTRAGIPDARVPDSERERERGSLGVGLRADESPLPGDGPLLPATDLRSPI